MTEDNLNDEVIKIFIESWLVKYENFTLVQQSLEKSFNDYKIVFRLRGRQLELCSINEAKVLKIVQIPDVDTDKCIAFAMEAYLVFHQVICDIKKNH
ncbi:MULTISPECIES: hypothetical protein [Acinetobacter]|uniref:Uncharacterized protein n=1 Tax=Acinetobacter junii TaxID=40215 RepID=A0A365PNZ4_ACIJU|nr:MULTISPECIES: hypothetical protein [Acinetobacter]RBA38489.1 hypothetical protein DDF86_05225 [Acinetobacter junii]RBA39736.1 hypothetical protein DDG62_10165 [Acinetobacter junii]RBA50373.1 hypothetical protein DC346_00130 [Acinetobacter junii]WLF72744.1 hypothetical protein Q4617_01280 [Acinetobacter junii]